MEQHDYNPNTPGTYTFSGTLQTNDYITNTGDGHCARATQSVTSLPPSPVLFGTAEEDLPVYESVQVKLEDGTVAYIPVSSWTRTNYNAEKAGTYSFVGTLDTSKYL